MAKRETQADFERVMRVPIAEAEEKMRAAVMDDPDRTDASMRKAYMQFALDIRRLVNRYLEIPDDTDQMADMYRRAWGVQ